MKIHIPVNVWMLSAVLPALLLGSCSKSDDPIPVPAGYEYFPLDSGRFTVYRVTDIAYRPTLIHDTSYYLQRERTGEEFVDARGLLSRRIYIERKDTSGAGEWVIDSVWHATKTTTQGMRTENNFPVVKIIFPVEESRSWNPNIFNTDPAESFRYFNVGKSIEVRDSTRFDEGILVTGSKTPEPGNLYFPVSLTVIQSDLKDDPIVGADIRREIYAPNIGMVYKEVKVWRRSTSADDAANFGKVIGGRFLKMEYMEHGFIE